jgi:hypothetical protein
MRHDMAEQLISAIRARAPDTARGPTVSVVLVVDPQSAEVDGYGPTTVRRARAEARDMRADLDAEGSVYADVVVSVVPLRPSSETLSTASLLTRGRGLRHGHSAIASAPAGELGG